MELNVIEDVCAEMLDEISAGHFTGIKDRQGYLPSPITPHALQKVSQEYATSSSQ